MGIVGCLNHKKRVSGLIELHMPLNCLSAFRLNYGVSYAQNLPDVRGILQYTFPIIV